MSHTLSVASKGEDNVPIDSQSSYPESDKLLSQSETQIEGYNSTIWLSEYADDIFQTLKEDELKRSTVRFRSKQLAFRPRLLDLLRNVTQEHSLSRSTLYLAIYLLDCFCDSFAIRADKLDLTALICLRIAAQLEESVVPKYSDLNRHARFRYQWYEYKSVQVKVMLALKFELLRPTTAHFLNHLSADILTLYDYHYNKASVYGCDNWNYESYKDMLSKLTTLLFELADLTINCHILCNARPSLIAASCIAVARLHTGVQPFWTPYLERLTTYSEDHIKPYIDIIHFLYRNHVQREELIRSGHVQDMPEFHWPQIARSNSIAHPHYYENTPDSGYNDEGTVSIVAEAKTDSIESKSSSIVSISEEKRNNEALKRSAIVTSNTGKTLAETPKRHKLM